MKKIFILIVIVLALSSLLFAQESATVIRVIDGDTIKVCYQDTIESLRFIGIDAPEKNEPGGIEATEFLSSLLHECDLIIVEFDKQKRDRYKRLLGYVYRDGTMLNEEILKAGYANVMTVKPNVKYRNRFQKAFEKKGGEHEMPRMRLDKPRKCATM